MYLLRQGSEPERARGTRGTRGTGGAGAASPAARARRTPAARDTAPRVQLLGSGTILREVIAAANLLAEDFGVVADVWSVPSFTELRREAIEVERWNTLHPTETPRKSHVETCLGEREG